MAIQVEFRRTVAAPVDEVFARIADIEGYGSWLSRSVIHLGCELVEPGSEVRAGTEFYDVTTTGRVKGRVTEYEPPARIAFEQRMRVGDRDLLITRPSYVLTGNGDHTEVVHRGEAELFGPFKIMTPVAKAMARSERRRTVEALVDSFAGG